MANENKGITLAQIRSGAKEFVLDNSTVSDDIRAVQVAYGCWDIGEALTTRTDHSDPILLLLLAGIKKRMVFPSQGE